MRRISLAIAAVLASLLSACTNTVTNPGELPVCQVIGVVTMKYIDFTPPKIDTIGVAYRKTPFCRVPGQP